MECVVPFVFVAFLYLAFCVLSKLGLLDADSEFDVKKN